MKGYRTFLFSIPMIIILALVFTACGTNPGSTTTGSGAGSKPTSGSTTTTGHAASAYGCPAGIVPNPPQGTPNVIVQPKGSNATTTAQNGDLIEVRMPFGQQWSGPSKTQGILKLQDPSGYTSITNKACIWRFIATGTGMEQLNFFARAICKKGAVCPMYVMRVPITINVK
jgi:hypothetical protein